MIFWWPVLWQRNHRKEVRLDVVSARHHRHAVLPVRKSAAKQPFSQTSVRPLCMAGTKWKPNKIDKGRTARQVADRYWKRVDYSPA